MGAVGVTTGILVKRVEGCCWRDYGNTSKVCCRVVAGLEEQEEMIVQYEVFQTML